MHNLEELSGAAHTIQVVTQFNNDRKEQPYGYLATLNDSDNETTFIATAHDANVSQTVNESTNNDSQYKDDFFYGMMVDTGCARAKICGLPQYCAHCRHIGQAVNLDTTRTVFYLFYTSGKSFLGLARCNFRSKTSFLRLKFTFLTKISHLFSLLVMCRLGIYFSSLENKPIHEKSVETAQIKWSYGHPFIHWDAFIQMFSNYTQLRRLHNLFGHPHADKFYNVLKRAELETVDTKTRLMLEDIMRKCKPCQTYAKAPRRFKFALRKDKYFNHTVFVDIFYIDSKRVLYVVDEATRYQAASGLPTVAAESVWRTLRLCWIYICFWPPDILTHDAEKQLLAKVFQSNAELLHIDTKCVPFESPNSMTYVERYHGAIRHGYNIMKTAVP